MFEKSRRLAYTFFRGARGTLDRLIWILRHHAYFWDKAIPFAAGAFAAQLASYSLFKIDVPSTVKYISLSIALLGFLSLYIHHFSLKPNGRMKDLSVNVGEGELIFENVGQSMLTNPMVNRRIENGANCIHYNKKLGKIDPLVDHFLVYFILNLKNGPNSAKLDTFDEKKLGLKTDISVDLLDRGGDVDIQRTSYFRDRLSNGLVNWRVEIKNRVAFDFIEETFDLIRTSEGNYFWRLKDLANSNLANQLGASALLITANGYVVYLTQGSRSAENSDKLAPSGSGSFDADSIGRLRNATLQELVHLEMRRELCEECGLVDADIHDVHICGYGRYLYRGGKPEFFCIATTPKSYSDISVPLRELDWQQSRKAGRFLGGLQRAGERPLASSIAEALEAHGSELEQNHHLKPVSGPLLWNIRIAADYLRHADDQALSRLLSPLLSNSSTERSTSTDSLI